MRPLRILVSTSIALPVAAALRLAAASPIYPADIGTDLSLTYDLGTTHCIICHETNSGGIGTVIRPFGEAMRDAGLILEDPPALETALNTLEARKTDSDCNGTPDIEQIKGGQDPNTAAYIDGSGRPTPADPGCGPSNAGPMPTFGCGAHIAPAPASSSWQGAAVLVAGLGLGLALVRRRRRR